MAGNIVAVVILFIAAIFITWSDRGKTVAASIGGYIVLLVLTILGVAGINGMSALFGG